MLQPNNPEKIDCFYRKVFCFLFVVFQKGAMTFN